MPTINVCPGSAQQLQEIADTLGKSRKVVVVTGAGISTNCGIPDFRSENGLYSLIQAQYDAALQNPPWEKTDSFDIDDRPKKKRRVTDRWYYEVVPGTGPAVQASATSQPPADEELRSPKSQSASQSNTGRSTPAASPDPDSSPLSSPRSITPQPPSEDFRIEDSSTRQQQTQSTVAAPSPYSRSLRSQTSRSSSVFTTEDISKESHSQSDSSAPSCSAQTDDIAIATELDQDAQFPSSPPSSTSEESPKDAPQLSQTTTTRTLPNLKGRDLFDSMIWSDPFTTSIFYMFISSLREKIQNEVTSTTETHAFLRVLRDGGRLVRTYTQNIDCLEEREGLCTELTRGTGNRARFASTQQRQPRPGCIDLDSPHHGGVEVVLLHGSLADLRCGICSKVCAWAADRQSTTLAGFAPDCPACAESNVKRTGRGRRGLAVGRLRPDIVLYGEEHPNASLIAPLITHDLGLGPDFLLIMGTSLRVHGLKIMVKEFAKAVHGRGGKVVFVNQTKPPESTWGDFIDYWVEWDCDEWVLDLQERRGDIWLPQGSQVESNKSRKSTSDIQPPTRKPSRAARPQALRDDKLNGVYNTFKILDLLGQLVDSNGAKATRPVYWDKPLRTVVATVKAEASKQHRKSLPTTKTTSKTMSRAIAKKRKSCPSALEDNGKPAYDVNAMWEKIRKMAPGLSATPPQPPRITLAELHHNRGFPINNIFHRSFDANHFPTVPGIDQMNLITHPPSGTTIPIHTPRSVPKPVERKPITHSYGTRASARLSEISAESTVVDGKPNPIRPSWNSVESTITVEENTNSTVPSCSSVEDTIIVTSTSPRPSISCTENTIVIANPSALPSPLSRPESSPTEETNVINDTPSRPSASCTEDTIVVANSPSLPSPQSRPSTGEAIVVDTLPTEDEQPPTPPISDPMTPSTQRIKRLGSLDTILSSPNNSGNSSATTVYYDAEDR